jgi:membrane protease YdiL (CAAX protease family)
MKWFAAIPGYLAVGLGLFAFRNAWIALLGFHLAIVLSLLIAKPSLPVAILFKGQNIKRIILSVLLCGSSGIALYFLWDKFGIVSDISAQTESFGLNSHTWLPFIAYFTLVNPFVEEYFWRGYLGSPTQTLYPGDFLYAGFHALILIGKMQTGSILYGMLALVTAGWFWRQIAREDHGLLAAALGHMAADFTILMTIYSKVA